MLDIIDLIALIGSGVAIVITVATFRASWKRDRKINSINAYTELQPYLFELSKYEDGEIEVHVTDRASEEYKVLSGCLAMIEIFATGVKEEVYDFEIVYPLAHGYIDGRLRKNIDYLIESKNPKNGKKYYLSTLWLLAEMDKRSGQENQSNQHK